MALFWFVSIFSRGVFCKILRFFFSFNNFINSINVDEKYIAHCYNSKKIDLTKILNQRKIKEILILIGPEGDFSPSEREFILSFSQVVPFTISKNILRSDTAVISAISLVNFINNLP